MNQNYDALKLTNQLCFPLYACAREAIKLYKPYAPPGKARRQSPQIRVPVAFFRALW